MSERQGGKSSLWKQVKRAALRPFLRRGNRRSDQQGASSDPGAGSEASGSSKGVSHDQGKSRDEQGASSDSAGTGRETSGSGKRVLNDQGKSKDQQGASSDPGAGSEASGSSKGVSHDQDDGNPPPDEENDLREQVKKLELEQEALAKKFRIEKLKLEVAERQRHVEQLTKLQGPTAPLVSQESSMFLKPAQLAKELIGDEDEAFLTDGILHGFKLALADCTFLPAQQNNYKSATSAVHKPKVEQTMLGELSDGNYVVTDIKPTIIRVLGAIPKPDSSDVRLIHDCSRPPGWALNDYISSVHPLNFKL
ncbi:uncharacterized protein [Porites lutea]|uniref:uncharacterized protein n=1 Tax=Porites lutea TaxID=51062 RepID=UPI003CC62F4A